MTKLVLIAIFLFNGFVNAQNLVLNGDFEDVKKCPDGPGKIDYVTSWSTTSASSSPDLIHSCVKEHVGIPFFNHFGKKFPRDGESFLGLVLINSFSERKKDYREYIQGILSEELKNNQVYTVQLDISWSSLSTLFCDRIGFLFSEKKILVESSGSRDVVLKRSSESITLKYEKFADRSAGNWTTINFDYKATGGEKYLIIGVFKDQMTKRKVKFISEVKYEPYFNEDFNFSGIPFAYYYIDNVLVVPKDQDYGEYTHH